MKILLSCGGTGGHINPALAIAEAFTDTVKDVQIAFCGTPHGMEATLIPQAGYPFYAIPLQGLRRSLSVKNLKAAVLTLCGRIRASHLLREYQPDLVIGTGGYVCYPCLRAAAKQGIFCAVHESNAIPGLATRLLAPHVHCVLTNFPQTQAALRAKNVQCVGNPLRKSFAVCDRSLARKKLGIPQTCPRVFLSFGGSLGAERINDVMLDWMRQRATQGQREYHIHVCGKRDFARMQARFAEYGLDRFPTLQLAEYLYDMPLYMSAADLILCRAGALSLSELAALHQPSILVPSPYVTDNHQSKNATVFSEKGAAILIEEKDLSIASVQSAWDSVFSSPLRYRQMADAAASFSKGNAAKKTVSYLLSEYQKRQ